MTIENKAKPEVYVLIDEWVAEEGGGVEVIGVYKRLDSAKKALREYVEMYNGPVYDVVEQTEFNYTTYNEGYYMDAYTNIMIITSRLED